MALQAIQVLLASCGIALAVLTIWPWLHRRLLPKPIPGIPYKKASARRILGDIPDVLGARRETGEMWKHIRELTIELNSPVIQMFMSGPFGKPWVIVSDFLEARDIQSHRQGEFDRSEFFADILGPLMPGCHVWMPSNDEFKAHRSMLRDTVSPGFIQQIVIPSAYTSVQDLLELWREKARLAKGRPCAADKDLTRNVVDLILLLSFGTHTGLNKSQAELLRGIDKVDLAANHDSAVVFPVADEPPEYTAIRTLADSLHIGMSSPAPKPHMKFALKFYPYLARARKYVDQSMSRVLRDSWKRLSAKKDGEIFDVTSASDAMVQREAQMAAQQNREVQYDNRVMRDELFGLYLGGHETSSSTLCWAIKNLTTYQGVQQKLRAALREAQREALESHRLPTADEIVKANVPYLDAFIEENHRMGAPVPTTIRRAMKDATILGHAVPKGTDIFMMMNGPSFQTPAFPIEDSRRSQTSRESKDRYGVWDAADVGKFMPERFLVQDEKGDVKYDPCAGPAMPYGAGLRGCFGIKLSMVKLKIILTMIVLAFELQETPPDLSTYESLDFNTHKPKNTYVRLVEIAI